MRLPLILLVLVVTACSKNSERNSFETEGTNDTVNEILHDRNQINKLQADKIKTINNTIWLDTIGEGCVNFIKFKTSLELESYICELGLTYGGKYYVKNDTIFYSIKGAICENCDSIAVTRKGKFIIHDNKLISVYSEYRDYQGIWVEKKIKDFTSVPKYKLGKPE